MKKAILLVLLLAGCKPDEGREIADKMTRATPNPVSTAPDTPYIPPGLDCKTKMVMGMAEITCR